MPATPFPSAYQSPDPSSSAPERSPLEPASAFQRRLSKFRRDRAWRAGQMQALQDVGTSPRPMLPNIEPGDNPKS